MNSFRDDGVLVDLKDEVLGLETSRQHKMAFDEYIGNFIVNLYQTRLFHASYSVIRVFLLISSAAWAHLLLAHNVHHTSLHPTVPQQIYYEVQLHADHEAFNWIKRVAQI